MNLARFPLATLATLATLAVAVALSLTPVGCVAVYPELDTRVSPVLKGQRLEPGPPEGILWVRILSGHLPDRTRDGRPWKAAFGKTPDFYAKLFINGREVLRTPVESNTLEPTWPKAPHGNFKLAVNDKLRVEIWDANPINDAPVGVRELGRLTSEQLLDKKLDAELEGGARVVIAIEPAHAVSGVGLWYEVRTSSVFITRMLAQSPAERAGLHPGDEVLTIGGRDVHGMQADEVRSQFNAIPFGGLKLQLRRVDTTRTDVLLKEGPIYPTFDQYGSID